MNRRDFLRSTLAAPVMGGAMASLTFAQSQAPAPAAAPRVRPYPGTTREIPLHAHSGNLQWLRTPADVAKACREISCRSLMVTVQDGALAHVALANVTSALPAFVRALRTEGIDVKLVQGGAQTAVDASVERLVGAMADSGITHYQLGTDTYDLSKPLAPQLDAIKRKVEAFVTLNQRFNATLVYHTSSAANAVGAGVWDLLNVLQGFDPKRVGLHWDTGEMSLHGPIWEPLFRAAGPYVAVIGWKDRQWKQDLGRFIIESGFFPGGGNQDGGGGDAGDADDAGGRAAGAGGRGGAAAGRGGGAAAGRAGGAGGRGAPPAPGAAAAGRGAAPTGASPLDGVPRPLAGQHFAKGMGWSSELVAMGTGLVNFFRYGEVLKEMNYSGLMVMQAAYAGLGGAESGLATITAPRRAVLGALKRDVLTVRTVLAQSGSGIMA